MNPRHLAKNSAYFQKRASTAREPIACGTPGDCCAQRWLVGSASLSMRLPDSASKGAVAAVPQLTCPALAQPFAAWPQPVTTQPQPPYSSPAVRAW